MNVFLREMKTQRNSLIFWCIGMLAMVGAGMAKYGAYQSSGTSVNKLMEELPRAVRIIFGVGTFDLSKAMGFYGLLFMYLVVMATIHSVVLGADIIAKEERGRTSEFLFTKPVRRTTIITAKLLAALVNLMVLNIVTLVSSILVVDYYNKTVSDTHGILTLMAGMFLLQIVFLSIGTSVAAISKKPRPATSMATAVLLVAFILSVVIDINTRLAFLRYVTPYKYFDAKNIIPNGQLDPLYLGLSGVIIAPLLTATYRLYTKRDLSV